MIEKILTVRNRAGIHARPAALIAQTANKFASEIFLEKENSSVQEKPAHTKRRGSTMDIISEAEDNLDDIIYSTRTIDINEVLKLEEEKKKQQRKAGKNNEK